ncbi:hypothetical protein BCR44DRAFT_65664 [Catenaria anguillulae PL171]|uniref:YncI copper-binding domain-containing protein n=1 Tax=Catenaria anguillulae PL171 TaxID=765915 RepID=A0A1Y2HGA7_9FUNG|nr:hypothetical protein BCR44DRAFT_65664 [Catenaria anguillulae PL171]
MHSSLLLVLLLAAASAHAHVTLSPSSVPRNAYVVTAVRVPHGCDGGAATSAVTVTIPQNVTNVKPEAVPGWTITMTNRPLVPPITNHGKTINETVDTVTWAGGPAIADAHYFDFGLMWKSPDAVLRIQFPVNQTCVGGNVTSWSQIRTNPQDTSPMPFPAPGVSITDAPPAAGAAPNATAAGATGKSSAGNTVVDMVPAVLAAGAALLFN